MKDKKSFLLYTDLLEVVEQLPDEKAGEFFKHILRFVNRLDPQTDDMLINLIFTPVKQSLERDLEKYKNIVERNKANGKKGGRPNKEINPKNAKVNKKIVIVERIDNRKEEFKNSLIPFLSEYDKDLLNEFYGYWTEHGVKDKKMRFEKEKSFGIGQRLGTWKKRQKKFNSEDKPKSNIERIGKMNNSLDSKIEKMYEDE